jgi:hypothetical protein
MTHDKDNPMTGGSDFPDALRWQLRGMRRDVAPERDLWPAIAQRIAATPQAPVQPTTAAWRRFAPLATAAALALAIGLAWQLRPSTAPGPDLEARLLTAEADAMTREYQAALLELNQGVGTQTPQELRVLDRSAAQIRTALHRDPDARFLLERLQRTYARRLELTQRLAQPTYTS